MSKKRRISGFKTQKYQTTLKNKVLNKLRIVASGGFEIQNKQDK